MLKIQIDAQLKMKILESRKAVDVYRDTHTQLHSKPWHRDIPEEHTPLLNKMMDSVKKQGFNSLLDTGIYTTWQFYDVEVAR